MLQLGSNCLDLLEPAERYQEAAQRRRLFTPPPDEPFALTDLEAEMRLLDPNSVPGGLQASMLSRQALQ